MYLNLILKIILNWNDPFFKLNEEQFTFHLQYKHSGTFANHKCIHKYEDLSHPKNPKMCEGSWQYVNQIPANQSVNKQLTTH